MNTLEDTCPASDYGKHRWFIFKTYDVYEPVQQFFEGAQLYQKVEYAVMGCNCAGVIRRKIEAA